MRSKGVLLALVCLAFLPEVTSPATTTQSLYKVDLIKSVPRLTERNYPEWKFRIEILLIAIGLAQYLRIGTLDESKTPTLNVGDALTTRFQSLQVKSAQSTPTPDSTTSGGMSSSSSSDSPSSSSEDEDDDPSPTQEQLQEAYLLIVSTIHSSLTYLIQNTVFGDVKGVWTAVKNHFDRQSKHTSHAELAEFWALRMKASDDFDAFIGDLTFRVNRLNQSTTQVTPEQKLTALFTAVNNIPYFENVLDAIEDARTQVRHGT
jgi:hypothetical protein